MGLPSEHHAKTVRTERIRKVYGVPGTPVLAGTGIMALCVVGLALLMWPVQDHQRVLLWALPMLVIEAGIAALIYSFFRRERSDTEIPLWGHLKTVQASIHGLGWALAMPMLYNPDQPISLVPLVGALIGLPLVNQMTTAVHAPSNLSFVSWSNIPASIWLLQRGGFNENYAASLLLFTFVLVLVNARREERIAGETLRLRLELADQAEIRRRLQQEAEEGRRLAELAGAEQMRFFGAASHDLRQPVHALGLYMALLSRDPAAAERRELIGNIAVCVDNLDRLFNAILGVAEASQSATRDQPPSLLRPIIERVLVQYGPVAEARGLRLSLRNTANDEHSVRADPAVVERILGNLVSNALHYTPAGGIVVGTRALGDRVELLVRDSGIGIAADDQRKVFDAFFRLRQTAGAADGHQGFGLGLATVRQLTITHGFSIRLHSVPGRGSLFRIGLPRADPQAAREAAPDMSLQPNSAADRLNVILLEDDPLVSDAVTRLLKDWGMAVHHCPDAGRVLTTLAKAAPGQRWHALLDFRLPGNEDGLAIARQIRAHHGASMAISLLTGEADPAVFEAAEALGLQVLHKPLRPIRLRAALEGRSTRNQPANMTELASRMPTAQANSRCD